MEMLLTLFLDDAYTRMIQAADDMRRDSTPGLR